MQCCLVDCTCSKATGAGRFFADSSGGRWSGGISGNKALLSPDRLREKSPIVYGLGGFFVIPAVLLLRQHLDCSSAAELNVTGSVRL